MQLTVESRRTRIIGLVVTWLLVAAVAYLHSAAVQDYVNALGRMGLRGAKAASTPLARICPTTFADTQLWVRNALALQEGAGPQLRYTRADNAPLGREVHWDSGLAWALAGAGRIQQLIGGAPRVAAVEQALAWLNLPLLLGVVVFFSGWVGARAGLGAGVLLAWMLVGNPDFYVGFGPNYVDHHGLLAAAVLGLVLGMVQMGVGFWARGEAASPLLPTSPRAARNGALLSAVCGAIGMWISAATLIPAFAFAGLAAVVAILTVDRRAAVPAVIFEPALWRLWGALGSFLCVCFYLLEYAPSHLGYRMEVNHPFYALAWWGGAELIAQIGEGRVRRGAPGGASTPGLAAGRWRALAALLAVAVAPITIAVGGERVFVVFDPFVTRLSAYVDEGLSLAKTIEVFGWSSVMTKAPWVLATLVLAVVLGWRSRKGERAVVVFILGLTTLFAGMAVLQIRWWPSASGPMMIVILLGAVAGARTGGAIRRWSLVGGLVALVCLPVIVGRTYEQLWVNRQHLIAPGDVVQPLYRDIAARLRSAQPQGDIILLASPNASGGIAYYGAYQSIGTLYWENLDGTKAAAAMFSAPSESDARRRLLQRHVTHVVMISDNNFLAEYFDLQRASGGEGKFEDSFGYQLLHEQPPPLWLEPIPYEPPPDLPLPGLRVQLYATKFNSAAAEGAFAAATADVNAGRLEAAAQKIDAALAAAPRAAEFWVIKAHLQLAREDVGGATESVFRAVDCASAAQLYALCTSEAVRLYQNRAPGAAAELYRRALAVQFDPTVANNLVWILATTSDDRVRNGPEALALAQLLEAKQADFLTLSGYAAALAECGRFPEAVAAAERAVAAAKSANDGSLVRAAESRLAAYGSGRSWRD